MGQVMCGRYEVGQCIGEGGMAWVYLARDRRLERLVVLKVLRDDRRDDAELRERFAREARSAAGLAHPNVLTVFDVDAHEGTPFIVLEHHAARDLAVVLRERGRIEPRRAVRMAIDVLDALECAHARGLIHRDLKPHNLLVTDRGEIKITDFGLAKAERSDSLTRTHGMVGTPRYMSPEQAQGQEIGPQTDLYALGVVLYEMLCGKPPFDGDNPVTIGLKHVQEPPAPLSSHGVDASPVLEEVVMTALRKTPSTRWSDATAMRRALMSVPEGAPASPAGTAGTPPRGGDGRDGGLVRTAGSPAPSMPSYSLADSGEFRAAPPVPPAPVDPAPSGSRSLALGLLAVLFLAGIAYAAYFWVKPPGEVSVPSLVGLEQSVARASVEKLNLRFTIKEFVYSDDPPGLVKQQSPAPGTSLRRGNDVLVVVSKGHQTVQVPTLIGLDREAARRALEQRGLSARFTEDYSDRVPLGQVASAEPATGTPVELQTHITVTISKGMPQVKAPALVGTTEKDATARAEAAGLKVRVVTHKPSTTVASGSVLEQTPPAGTGVSKGSTIEIIVSSGPESRGVPSLKGLSLADARRNAEQQGFTVVVEGGSASPDARVTDQSPEGGVTMAQGGVIHVSVEAPPPTPENSDESVVVPGLRGLSLDAARAALEERGLRVGNTEAEESDLPSGSILRQSPEESANARRGSTVDVVIAEKRSEPQPRESPRKQRPEPKETPK